MEKFYPDFRNLANADSTNRIYTSMMEYRILMYKRERQIYGSQASYRQGSVGNPEYFIWLIENHEEVNQRGKVASFEENF